MQVKEEFIKAVPKKETILTVGVFDGVHLGHQYLLAHIIDRAREKNYLSGVVTFKVHPQIVLCPGSKLPQLSELDRRLSLLRGLGIDVILALTFTPELAQLSARDFVQLLKEHMKMRGLVVGPDFALGKGREGNIAHLITLGQEMDFTVDVVSPSTLDGEVVSSSAIRQILTHGDVKKVGRFLGRPFSLSGKVVSGDGRGKTLGFPTANIDIPLEQALPSDGVYATLAHVDHKVLPSITNVGIRPTFGGGRRTVETYLLDYAGHLLERKLEVDFIDRLRGEIHFDTAEDLKVQIGKDIEQTRVILEKLIEQEGTLPRR